MRDAMRDRRPPAQKYSRLHETPPPLRAPKVPKKDLALSLGLFFVGIMFLLAGASTFWHVSFSEAMPFTMLGSLCFIPGAYHTWIFYMIFKKVPGYSYDMITSHSS
mmetsp:Transcript_77166/g.195916  ORF Transcript_77166/g.195916 Transcript_77166/m.195916 type:complete len:106 (+) Transcript_77166:176-493(+)